jgi:hypothetical protein
MPPDICAEGSIPDNSPSPRNVTAVTGLSIVVEWPLVKS